MKTALFLILFSFPALADIVKVSHMSNEPGMRQSFILKTQLEEKVTLDCQSFMNGIYIGPRDGGLFFMLDASECESLYNNIKSSLGKFKKHCIDIEGTVKSDEAC
jgi:hypothetical protein